jgi:HEAT repeat protein
MRKEIQVMNINLNGSNQSNPNGSKETEEISARLSDQDPRCRHEAREQLVSMGVTVLPVLYQKLTSPDWHVRWEAAKALGEIGDPAAAEMLVALLQDDDTSVRWAAMGSLIDLGRGSLRPVLEALTHDFQSARLREGVHHILHTLANRGKLTGIEAEVFRALEGAAPSVQAAWAANKALIAERDL